MPKPAPPARRPLGTGLYRACVTAGGLTLASALVGAGAFIWLFAVLDAGKSGWQDAMMTTAATSIGASVATTLAGIVAVILCITALRREAPPGPRRRWIVASLAVSAVCIVPALGTAFVLLVVGAFLFVLGGGRVG